MPGFDGMIREMIKNLLPSKERLLIGAAAGAVIFLGIIFGLAVLAEWVIG